MSAEPVAPFLEPRHAALRAAAARLAAEITARPLPSTDAEARREGRALVTFLGGAGLLRHLARSPWGDEHAPDLRAACLIREALAAASPLADAMYALQGLGPMPLVLAGTAEQRERWLPAIVAGEAIAGFAMTEPGAGSDVAALSTTARRDGDGFVLDGDKHLISNAGLADVYTVFARTTQDAGSRGISCFVVPADQPGLRFAGEQVLSSPHPLGRLAFAGCRIPASALVGELDGGFRLGMMALDRLRVTVAAAACGMARRALDEALAHAHERVQFGRPLADQQLIQRMLAESVTELDAARLLTYRAAAAVDATASRPTRAVAEAKAFATEAAQRIVDRAVQVFGGRGVLAEHPVDRLYRSVRALRIYEGATEVQWLVIARELAREREGSSVT